MWTCRKALAFVKTLYSVPFFIRLKHLFVCFYYDDQYDTKVNNIVLLYCVKLWKSDNNTNCLLQTFICILYIALLVGNCTEM